MNYAAARMNMVEGQIRPNKVTDSALVAALATVPREAFLPPSMRGMAYVDESIHIGGGRYLMEPMVLARLIQLAEVRPSDIVLDIGCACGYSAAILARLANTVVAVESDPDLVRQAGATLAGLSIDNVLIIEDELKKGCTTHAPYNAVLFDGAVGKVPLAIVDQLAEGSRLVAILRKGGIGRAVLMRRHEGVISSRIAFDAAAATLPGFAEDAGFVF